MEAPTEIDQAARRAAVGSGTAPVPLWRLWTGVALAPAAWVVGGLLGYYLASRSCEPVVGGVPLAGTARPELVHVVLEVVLAGVATIGLVTALRNVLVTRHREAPGDAPALGRAYFLALTGSVVSAVFVFGIVLVAFSGLVVDVCRQGR